MSSLSRKEVAAVQPPFWELDALIEAGMDLDEALECLATARVHAAPCGWKLPAPVDPLAAADLRRLAS